jgi:hypothetical protein
MDLRRPQLPAVAALAIGMGLGWALAGLRGPRAMAGGADRWGDSAVLTGPIVARYNPKMQVQVTDDAIYYLNYATGHLLATSPTYRQTAAGVRFLGEFAERDLVRDFELAPGTAPHFLLTTSSLGSLTEGGTALLVFETTTGQVATYRMTPGQISAAGAGRPAFELLERRTDRRLAQPPPR